MNVIIDAQLVWMIGLLSITLGVFAHAVDTDHTDLGAPFVTSIGIICFISAFFMP